MAEYCEECGADLLTDDRRDDLRKWFEYVQQIGSEKFGEQWLMFNQCAVEAAARLGIDASDRLICALLSETCYRILVRLKAASAAD